MKSLEREITKDEYDLIVSYNENGNVVSSIEDNFFNVAQICGYGVYGARAVKIGDKYILQWSQGSSCD